MGLNLLKIKLSKEEFWTGFTHSAVWTPFQGWYALPSALLSGYLWALGGAKDTKKAWRRIGCPLTICVAVWAYKLGYWHFLSLPLAFWVLTIGYGIPSWNGPENTQDDDGSWLGRFCYFKLCHGPHTKDPVAEKCATTKVRAILAFLFGLAMAGLCVYGWIWWVVGVLVLTIIVPIIVNEI